MLGATTKSMFVLCFRHSNRMLTSPTISEEDDDDDEKKDQ
jgi:hypothetical protein